MFPHSPADRSHRRSRALLMVLALAFAAWTLLYAICWIIAATRPVPNVELGFAAPEFLAAEHALRVSSVSIGSPAEKAGMRPGDRIIAIDGERLENMQSQVVAWSRHQPGDHVRLKIDRLGEPSPIVLVGTFRRATGNGSDIGFVGTQLQTWFPVPFVVVGLTVLFLRLEDRNVWLLALLLGSFTTIPGLPSRPVAPSLDQAVRTYQWVFLSLLGPLFYSLFTVFPARSAIDRRVPWLKWASVAFGLWMGLGSLGDDKLWLPAGLPILLGDRTSRGPFWYEFAFLTLGLVALAMNVYWTTDREAQRKVRVLFWGTAAGVAPGLALFTVQNLGLEPPAWTSVASIALAFLFPLSFAYAVVKHRVLDIPVLLKRSVRYLLVQRGFAISLSLVSIALTLLVAFSFASHLQPFVEVAGPSGIVLGAIFGTVVLWSGLRVHRQVSERIDRAFFRRAYDARIILEDLANQTRRAADREQLARLLERSLGEALEPAWLIVYLAASDGRLVAVAGQVRPELATIAPDAPMLGELAARGQPWEYRDAEGRREGDASPLAALDPDCLVPVLDRSRRLKGLLVLGSRRSEEPYSGEDKRLLASVASHAGIALDNIRFAEELAERIEHERRAAQEMEIAREVQTRLLPQAPPQVRTADCAARCIQARSVGGDYYDFLDLGAGRVGLVLADVSGKGVHAALLSASLQAHLRSQAAIAPLDPVRLLCRVNEILWKSTAAQHYATLFFGIYDDGARHLRYVNCGHNPPLLLRPDGTIEHLAVTAPVVGLFEAWACSAGEVQLGPGDLLAVFSDGITDATCRDEEFGEARLIEQLRTHREASATGIVAAVLDHVQEFSAGEQSDDLTLLIARVR